MVCAPSHSAPDSALGGGLAAPRLENPITLSDNHHASFVTATGQFLDGRAQSDEDTAEGSGT